MPFANCASCGKADDCSFAEGKLYCGMCYDDYCHFAEDDPDLIEEFAEQD